MFCVYLLIVFYYNISKETRKDGYNMKFTVDTKVLRGLVTSVIKAVPSSNITPMFKGIFFSVENGKLSVTCMNDNVVMRNAVDVNGEDGSCILSAEKIDKITDSVDGETISMQDDGNYVSISSGKSVFKLLKMQGRFPSFPVMDGEYFTVDGGTFRSLVGYTNFATSSEKDTGVPQQFSGINISLADKVLKAGGSNTHRIAIFRKDMGMDGEFNITLPAKVLTAFAKVLNDDTVVINIKGNRAYLSQGDFEVVMNGLSGTFPQFEKVIPTTEKIKVTMNCMEFLGALTRISVFSENNSSIKMSVKDDCIVLYAQGSDIGSGEEPVDATVVKGDEPFEVAFNGSYLEDAVKVVKGEKVTLSFNTNLSPVKLEVEGADDFLYIVSPQRTR